MFFVDAAHFVLGGFLAVLWCFTRQWIKAPSGRQRFNILAALNAITLDVHMVTNATYINAESVCTLLRDIAALSLTVPITLVLDNAPYQRCRLVTELAAQLNIELLFLPPYSPNLNLIERLWKFVRKKCLYGKYYENFSSFSSTLDTCLRTANVMYSKELKSLLTLNFQTFSKVS